MSIQRKKRKSKKKTKVPSLEWNNIKGVKRERLILERKKKGLTQGELAKLLSVSTSTISHLENGRIKPSLEVESGLLEIFNVPFEKLFPDL
ncbi:helix-turn-helix transcriptional regulator [Fictibacillus gelatini]|uniref:helix-turn-helix transcriptional regulator n=1 Tax=Fictibacillus gelatini TaxID=225985 RepID=UPI0004109F4E|nr:helix-turn-helix transcriptional regulator [Fictibacillus gelatini]